MGRSAAIMAQWIGMPTRFADFYNGSVFCGEKVIQPEELELISGESHKLEEDKDKNKQEIHRYRDVIMHWKKYGINLAILAIENQQNIHLAMPVRNMMYDSLAYQEQIDVQWNLLSKEEKKKCNKKEFLSHYLEGQKLKPVITLVFYYGDEEWKINRELHDMLELDGIDEKYPKMKAYIPNYKINVVDIVHMKDIFVFRSDLQQVFGMLKYKGSKDKLNNYINQNSEYFNNIDRETALVIGELLNSEEIIKTAEEIREGEQINMCKALEDLKMEGRLEGMIDLCKEFGLSLEATIVKVAEKLGETEEMVKDQVEEYYNK